MENKFVDRDIDDCLLIGKTDSYECALVYGVINEQHPKSVAHPAIQNLDNEYIKATCLSCKHWIP